MNKRWQILICIITLVWCGVGTAALIDRGGGMIYDSDLNVTWLQDANYAMTSGYDVDGLMDWGNAVAWAETLSFGGYDDWRLPSFDPDNPRPTSATPSNEIGSLWSELGGGLPIGSTTDISPFFNLQFLTGGSEWYWTGIENANVPTRAWRISLNCACWDFQNKENEYYAWAVRTGDVSVPEPASILLLGLGLVGFGWIRRRS